MNIPKNNRLINALRRQPVDVTPIWIMRQAGRYLPEYRQKRNSAGDFMTLCKTPQLACEVTLQPLIRFPLDAAILFSDILTIPDAMGLGLEFLKNEGPNFKKTIRSKKDVESLTIPHPEKDLGYVLDAIKLIRKELNNSVPLIGFSGSPWTLATYMVEGKSSKDFRYIKTMLFDQPDVLHSLLEKLCQSVVSYLNGQIHAGVQAIQIFDTWGGILSEEHYLMFSLSYMSKILKQLDVNYNQQHIPIILFTKNGGQWLEHIANTGTDAISIDWTTTMKKAKAQVGNRVALQGNLDPCVLYASDSCIRNAVKRILGDFRDSNGHVFNLGHGILPDISPDKVSVLIDAVHEFSKK